MAREQELIAMVWALTDRARRDGRNIYPGHIRDLIRLSRRLRRLSELSCNRELSKREEAASLNAMNRVLAIADEIGVKVYHQGDPRGATVWIIFPGDINTDQELSRNYTNGVAIY